MNKSTSLWSVGTCPTTTLPTVRIKVCWLQLGFLGHAVFYLLCIDIGFFNVFIISFSWLTLVCVTWKGRTGMLPMWWDKPHSACLWQAELYCIILHQAQRRAYFSLLLQDQNTTQPGCETEQEGRKKKHKIKNSLLDLPSLSISLRAKHRVSRGLSTFLPLIKLCTIPPCAL